MAMFSSVTRRNLQGTRAFSPATSRTPSPPPVLKATDALEGLPSGARTPLASFRSCSPRLSLKGNVAQVKPCFPKVACSLQGSRYPATPAPRSAVAPPPGLLPPPGLFAPTELQAAVPPPPQPFQFEQQLPTADVELSIGSMGHPGCCAGPCRYVKRKGGCKDGAKCPKCHLCFWRRGAEGEQDESSAMASPQGAYNMGGLLSAGTKGHPFTCATPCKYVRRKGGCREGANCPNCHECLWQRAKGTEEEAPKQEQDQQQEQQQDQKIGEVSTSFFGNDGLALQGLIETLLKNKAA